MIYGDDSLGFRSSDGEMRVVQFRKDFKYQGTPNKHIASLLNARRISFGETESTVVSLGDEDAGSSRPTMYLMAAYSYAAWPK